MSIWGYYVDKNTCTKYAVLIYYFRPTQREELSGNKSTMKNNKTRVYYGNQYEDINLNRTKLQGFVAETKRIGKNLLILTAVVGTFGLGVYGYAASTVKPEVVKAQVTVDESPAMFASKIDALKDKVVNQIKDCERNGHSDSDGLVTYDPRLNETVSSNIPSFGLLQFKQSTVIFYEKSLYGKVVNGKEALMIALDDVQASALAKDVMFKTSNMAGKDWVNCSTRLDSDRQIKLIKQLEK